MIEPPVARWAVGPWFLGSHLESSTDIGIDRHRRRFIGRVDRRKPERVAKGIDEVPVPLGRLPSHLRPASKRALRARYSRISGGCQVMMTRQTTAHPPMRRTPRSARVTRSVVLISTRPSSSPSRRVRLTIFTSSSVRARRRSRGTPPSHVARPPRCSASSRACRAIAAPSFPARAAAPPRARPPIGEASTW